MLWFTVTSSVCWTSNYRRTPCEQLLNVLSRCRNTVNAFMTNIFHIHQVAMVTTISDLYRVSVFWCVTAVRAERAKLHMLKLLKFHVAIFTLLIISRYLRRRRYMILDRFIHPYEYMYNHVYLFIISFISDLWELLSLDGCVQSAQCSTHAHNNQNVCNKRKFSEHVQKVKLQVIR